MDHANDFATILRASMARATRTSRDLARLTGIPLRTIENWAFGRARRPRSAADVLKLARALVLDAPATSAMLRAAGYPPLEVLRLQNADPQLHALLATWEPAAPAAAHTDSTERFNPAAAIRHQIRPPVADFVGREAEASHLTGVLLAALERGSGAVVSGLYGMGGIGKTELAFLLAQHLRAAAPDAQLVLNLRGSGHAPLSAVQALQTVIRAFAPETPIEADLETLQARYHSVLHGQRVLIIADDASDAAQVRPLLPPQGCVLLVTSRHRFALPGMLAVNLEVLAEAEAVALLRTLCERLEATDAAALARACGYLPLALRISGSILQINPALSVAGYLRALGDERQRLAKLRDPDDPQLDVASSLALSYAQLDAGAQAVFRQLGVLAADFAAGLALAVVAAPDGTEVTAVLHTLLRRNLVMYDAARGRWRLHDLVRDLARRYLEMHGEADEAQWRYARAVVALAQNIQDQYLAGATAAALAQFDTERAHMDAARRCAERRAGMPDGDQLLLDIALATRYIGLLRYDPRQERFPLWEGVRAAAQRLGNRAGEGLALNNLGLTYRDLGELPKAVASYEQRLVIIRALGDRRGEGVTLNNLGIVYHTLGERSKAISAIKQALAIAREIGNRQSEGPTLFNLGLEGIVLLNLGNVFTDLGDTQGAITACDAALAIMRAAGARREEGYALGCLARAQAMQGNLALATTSFDQAVRLLQEVGDRWGEAECRWLFGLALAHHGERERALPLLRAALAYEREIGYAKAAEHAAVLARLEVGEPAAGPPDQEASGLSLEKKEVLKVKPPKAPPAA